MFDDGPYMVHLHDETTMPLWVSREYCHGRFLGRYDLQIPSSN